MSEVYTATQTNFSGADADNGLFDPALDQAPSGSGKFVNAKMVADIKLITFTTDGATPDVNLFVVNPVTSSETLLKTFTLDDYVWSPGGTFSLPCGPDGTPFTLKAVSTGGDADCEFSVVYDLEQTRTTSK